MQQIEQIKVFKSIDGRVIDFINVLLTLEQYYKKNMKKWTQKNISNYINCYLSYNLRNGYYLLVDGYFLINLTKIYIKYLRGGN